MTLPDVVGILPLSVLVALAVGGIGRHTVDDVLRTSLARLVTLLAVLVLVAGTVRLLIALFV